MKDRLTIRLNDVEKAELKLFMAKYNIDVPSEAYKVAVNWVNTYIENVTKTFFPANYDLILSRKSKSFEKKRKIY